MAYVKPYIDVSGLHLPSYIDIRDDLISQMKIIYGEDIYLEPDSQDYEMISIIADKVSDVHSAIELAYNNFNPGTAIGGALTSVVKVNGIRRKRAGNSISTLRISGKTGTTISNGKAGDSNNHLWKLPALVTIPMEGFIDVEASCQSIGQIFADSGTINRIMTPTLGWLSVTNPAKAITGQEVETDSQLRARQVISVARPSRTVLLGTQGGIAEIKDVTRSKVYENDTGSPDEHGIPGHTISAIVEGGEEYSIAEEIYYRKTPGTGTYGDIAIKVTEEMEQNPVECPPIKFFRPKYIDAFVKVTVSRKYGYVEQTTIDIKDNILEYLSSLQIGSDLVQSALYAPVWGATKDIKDPSFAVESINIGKTLNSLSDDDIEVLFNEVTRGIEANVTIEVI